jgi:hypothetical protein
MSRIIKEAVAEAKELFKLGLMSEKEYNKILKIQQEDEAMKKEELKFKHINIHESFIFITNVYVKLSKTKAVDLFGQEAKFKKEDEVSKIKSMNISSFAGGSCNVKYDRSVFNQMKQKRIQQFNEQK